MATTAEAESEMVPVVNKKDEDLEIGIPSEPNLPPEPPEFKGFLKPVPETTTSERMAGGVGGVAVVTALIAMIVEQSVIVILGGILSAVLGPYMYYQQTRLTDIKTLQETKQALSEEVTKLSASNEQLITNIDNMTSSVDKLQEIDVALTLITETQGLTVEKFREQVTENKSILKKMKTNVKANVLQNLLSVILRADSNRDFNLDENEIDGLIHGIQNISGVVLHESKFRQAISGQSIQGVMAVVQDLLKDENSIPEQERIFDIVSLGSGEQEIVSLASGDAASSLGQ